MNKTNCKGNISSSRVRQRMKEKAFKISTYSIWVNLIIGKKKEKNIYLSINDNENENENDFCCKL